MIIVETKDFRNNDLKSINQNLLSYVNFNDEQKEAYKIIIEDIINNKKIIGKNKSSVKEKKYYKNIFKDLSLWHYHCGLSKGPYQLKQKDKNIYLSTEYQISGESQKNNNNCWSECNIINPNYFGLVCDFLIHYSNFNKNKFNHLEEDIIVIYCASSHKSLQDNLTSWEIISNEL